MSEAPRRRGRPPKGMDVGRFVNRDREFRRLVEDRKSTRLKLQSH